MINVRQRLEKLESAFNNASESIHIMLTYVDPGDSAPIGYRCGEVEVIRWPDEAEEDFKTRCHDSVVWPFGNSCHSFHPMYADAQ
jgi:hypothetical protein